MVVNKSIFSRLLRHAVVLPCTTLLILCTGPVPVRSAYTCSRCNSEQTTPAFQETLPPSPAPIPNTVCEDFVVIPQQPPQDPSTTSTACECLLEPSGCCYLDVVVDADEEEEEICSCSPCPTPAPTFSPTSSPLPTLSPPPTCPSNNCDYAFQCGTKTLYVCWSLISPRDLGLGVGVDTFNNETIDVEEESALTSENVDIEEVVYCKDSDSSFQENPYYDVGDQYCSNICSSTAIDTITGGGPQTTTCPNGEIVTRYTKFCAPNTEGALFPPLSSACPFYPEECIFPFCSYGDNFTTVTTFLPQSVSTQPPPRTSSPLPAPTSSPLLVVMRNKTRPSTKKSPSSKGGGGGSSKKSKSSTSKKGKGVKQKKKRSKKEKRLRGGKTKRKNKSNKSTGNKKIEKN